MAEKGNITPNGSASLKSTPGSDTARSDIHALHQSEAQERHEHPKEDETVSLTENPSPYLGCVKLYIIVFALLLSMFLVSVPSTPSSRYRLGGRREGQLAR